MAFTIKGQRPQRIEELDDVDYSLVKQIRNASGDEAVLKNITNDLRNSDVTKACRLWLSQHQNEAPSILGVSMALDIREVVRLAANNILQTKRFSPETESEARAALKKLEE